MINLFNAHLDSVSLHRVGNKSRNEGFFFSSNAYLPNNELALVLKEYFLKPFREKEENYYQFVHEVDLDYHTLYKLSEKVFNNPLEIHSVSKEILEHLYEQSQHAHIKPGEVYVCYFSNILLDNKLTDAIGIFKSELKTDFIQVNEKDKNLDIQLLEGINVNKLDKGCLIFNTEKEQGYKILSVDSNRYDAKYWLEHFLNVDVCLDENFMTKKYLKFCQDFAKDIVLPAEDKREEVLFMNRTLNHFAKNDAFEESKFLNEVIDNPDLIPEFKNYKVDKGAKYSIEDLTEFPIANTAVTDARKKIKNTIQLDTNIQIKLDFINPESAEKFVEKGWDEERQMYYYLVYFNKEQKS